MALICWSLKNLDQVTKSSLASETLALSEAAETCVLIAAMVQETFTLLRPPEVFCKINSAYKVETLISSDLVSDKCLRIEVA